MLKASCAKFQHHKYSTIDTASFAKKPSTIHIPTFGENNFPVILSLTCCYWLLSHKGHKERESKWALFWVWRILKKSVREKKLTVDNFEVLQWRSRPELFGPDVGIDAWKDGHLAPFWFTKTNVPTQPSTELKTASCSFPSSTETFMRDKVSEYWWTMVQFPSSSWSWTNQLSMCPVFEPKTELLIWRNLFHFERERVGVKKSPLATLESMRRSTSLRSCLHPQMSILITGFLGFLILLRPTIGCLGAFDFPGW